VVLHGVKPRLSDHPEGGPAVYSSDSGTSVVFVPFDLVAAPTFHKRLDSKGDAVLEEGRKAAGAGRTVI